ncbi:MAG TPA: TatD family hydrolase [Hydrogenophilus thermoluteolus]|nr:TatD family hydrolase [Hydrogenophilus thermoluteolus]
MTQLIDTHCHLEFPGLKERLNEVLANMAANRVVAAVSIGTTLERAREVLEIAEAHPNIWATVGVHPDNEGVEEPTVDRLVALANHAKVVAIGETGLDYYRLTDAPEWQRTRFRTHIQAARTLKLPLVIHTRAAAHDTIAILREEGAEAVGGVMHCFTESRETAKAALDLGFYISFSGIATFKNAASVREVARYVPLDRILVETDAPYLAPVPHRGKRCEPAFVRHTAEFLAEFLGIDFATFAERTTENACRLFSLRLTHLEEVSA